MADKLTTMPPAIAVPSRRATLARLWQRFISSQEFVVLVLFSLVVVVLSLLTDEFLSRQNLTNVARNFSWIAVVAFGQSMVIIIGGIDLSVGATMALAGLTAARVMQLGVPVPVALVIGLLVGMTIGMANGIMVARIKLPAFIVTLGTMSIARGITYGLTRGWSVINMPHSFLMLGQRDILLGGWSLPVPALVTLGLALLIGLFLKRTVVGDYIFAMSSGERALIATGVDVVRVKVLVYTICGVLAAVGGLLMTARLGMAAPAAAMGYEVDIVAAAVIGGTSLSGGAGSILGMLLGAAITQMFYNGLVILNFPPYWQTMAIGTMVLVAVFLDHWQRQRQRRQ